MPRLEPRSGPATRERRRACRGVSLVELMISMGILTVVAGGVMGSMLYSQRYSQANLAASYAEVNAQSIIEQIVRLPRSELMEPTVTSVPILVPYVQSDNTTKVSRLLVPWATDETYTDFGPEENPERGVLIDAAYIANGNIIRPERHMKMRINLSRDIAADENRVIIIVRYQWEVPDRKGPGGTPIFLSSQLTTARSTATSF